MIAPHHSRRLWQGRIAPGSILAAVVAAMIFAAKPHLAALAAQRGQRRGDSPPAPDGVQARRAGGTPAQLRQTVFCSGAFPPRQWREGRKPCN